MSTAMRVRVAMWIAVVALTSSAGVAHAGAGDVGEKGEQLYIWHLDEGTGDEVEEASGEGPPGVFVGEVAWGDGVSGGGLVLSGALGDTQYIEFPGDDDLDITQQLTMAAWVKLDAHPAGDQANKGTIFYKNTYYLQVEPPDGALAYYFYDTAPEGYHVSGDTIPTGEWAHVALVWDGSVVRYYINGEKDATRDRPVRAGTIDAWEDAARRW